MLAPVKGQSIDRGAVASITLQWHRGAQTVAFEGFQRWALTSLKMHLAFDHAIWGMGAGVENGDAFINSVHLYRLDARIMVDYDQVRSVDPLAEQTSANPEKVVALCMADAQWAGSRYDALRAHAQKYGLVNILCLASSNVSTGAVQFITLARAEATHRFTDEEIALFELLAPHLIQAFSTKCALQVSSKVGRRGKPVAQWTTAIVDGAGLIHDHDAEFLKLMSVEWPAWSGRQLPQPLHKMLSRRADSPWRFLGEGIAVEFTPVNDLLLLAVRARVRADLLSERERFVAQMYADGASHKDISEALQLAPATVRAHVRNVFAKLGINNKSQLGTVMA